MTLLRRRSCSRSKSDARMYPAKLISILLTLYSTLCSAVTYMDNAYLAKYSIKFESCRVQYPAGVAENVTMEEASDGFGERRRLEQMEEEDELFFVSKPNRMLSVVTFRMCPTATACDSSCEYSADGQTFVVSIGNYLSAVVEHIWDTQEQYCNDCNECVEQEVTPLQNVDVMDEVGVDNLELLAKGNCASIDTSACYDECQKIENMESNGYIDAAEFIGCQMIHEDEFTNQKYYAGATCSFDGSRIKIGVFLDERCTIPDSTKEPDDFIQDENGYAMKLSHSALKQTYATGECVATCLKDENYDFNQPEINTVCERLYSTSSLQSESQYNVTMNMSPTPDPTSSTPGECDSWRQTLISSDIDSSSGVSQSEFYSFLSNIKGPPYVSAYFIQFGDFDSLTWMARIVHKTLACQCENLGMGAECCEGVDVEVPLLGLDSFSGSNGDDKYQEVFCQQMVLLISRVPTPSPTLAPTVPDQPTDRPTPYFDDDAGWEPSTAWADDDSTDDAIFPVTDEQIISENFTVKEFNALSRLYRSSSRGDGWERSDNWLSDSNVCVWHGVRCNEGGSVTDLYLNGNSLQGYFEGSSLGQLGNLTRLDLGNNELVGVIPEEIGYIWQLTHLNLANNRLGRSLPNSLAWLPHLESLELQGNQFTSIQINNGYSSLRNLNLGDNRISGTIQHDVARLYSLEQVLLRGNMLVGGLADDYSLLTELTQFDVSSNMISGALPERAFSENPRLEVLNLSYNRLEGSLPNFGVAMLELNVVGNMIDGIDFAACVDHEWNNGITLKFGCDGIVCPPGTSNIEGRQTSEDTPCEPCLDSSSAPYFGTVGCNEGIHEEDCTLECQNGGVCMKSQWDLSLCTCPLGYTGIQCETILQPSPSPSLQLPRSSYLQIISPPNLVRKGGYYHQLALFGPSTYNITANVYYSDSDLCNGNVDTSKGYPIREMNENNSNMAAWPSPFLLMVDRGQCTFVTKVRNAQNVGASAVIIADNTCLCASGDVCTSDPGISCEERIAIVADDGSAVDIVIPSVLMLKQDADLVKAAVRANNDVMMEMASSQQLLKYDQVEYELWLSPMDVGSRDFLIQFMEFAEALGPHALFTPRIFIYDGIERGCINRGGENVCNDLCTNGGRYCAADPFNEELDGGVSGPNILKESLRWLCIWHEYGKDGVGAEWWNYISLFSEECANNDLFTDEDCVNNVAMEEANINPQLIDRCMDGYGGLESDEPNKLLEENLRQKQELGITTVPTLIVNKRPIGWEFDSVGALEIICSAFADGSAPPVCQTNAVIGPTLPPPVIGYSDLGRGSCQDERGKGYSYIQKTTKFPSAALCAEECANFRISDSYRGFEYSVAQRCTCLFDTNELPPITESLQYISKEDGGYGAVAGVSGTPGATCYRVLPSTFFDTAGEDTTLPSTSLNYTLNQTGTTAPSSATPSSVPSFTPSSKPPSQLSTASPEPIFEYPNSGQIVFPCRLLLILVPLSIFR